MYKFILSRIQTTSYAPSFWIFTIYENNACGWLQLKFIMLVILTTTYDQGKLC